jgi:hypothetical protein
MVLNMKQKDANNQKWDECVRKADAHKEIATREERSGSIALPILVSW